jgi:Flp pilus assembly protein TadD
MYFTAQSEKEDWFRLSYSLHDEDLAAEEGQETALAAYEQAIQLAPREGSLRYHKGSVLEQMGRHEEAQRAYEEARSLGYTR